MISLHVRAPMGTRIEETAALFDHVEKRIRQIIPPRDLDSIVDNIGLPVSGTNRAYLNTGGIGPEDGDILITLKKGHRATAGYVKDLRTALPQIFPGFDFRLPARRYRQPDLELRLARADRCAGLRPRQAGRAALCHQIAAQDPGAFPAPPMPAWSSPRAIRNSASMWTAPAPA